jgi:hypothetical protein
MATASRSLSSKHAGFFGDAKSMCLRRAGGRSRRARQAAGIATMAGGRTSITRWIEMARRGMIVLAFDPPGQASGLSNWDGAAGKSRVGIVRASIRWLAAVFADRTNMRVTSLDRDSSRRLPFDSPRCDPKRRRVAAIPVAVRRRHYLAMLEPRLAAAAPSWFLTS